MIPPTVDMDNPDDKVMGLASGHLVSYPHRDYTFLERFDDPYHELTKQRKEKEKHMINIRN